MNFYAVYKYSTALVFSFSARSETGRWGLQEQERGKSLGIAYHTSCFSKCVLIPYFPSVLSVSLIIIIASSFPLFLLHNISYCLSSFLLFHLPSPSCQIACVSFLLHAHLNFPSFEPFLPTPYLPYLSGFLCPYSHFMLSLLLFSLSFSSMLSCRSLLQALVTCLGCRSSPLLHRITMCLFTFSLPFLNFMFSIC